MAPTVDRGADRVVIDTPHADLLAREACRIADLILIPCRPQAFDLSAVETTVELVKATGRPAFVLFMAGPPRAPVTYEARGLIEGTDGVAGLGVPVASVMLTQHTIYRHGTAQGRTASEAEPDGTAAQEAAALRTWVRERVNLPTARKRRTRRGEA